MGTLTTKDGVEIFYKDWGKGQPIVFSHGWPLSADDLDTQMLFFLQNGYRVIAHDRRGHGRSTQVSDGHDMDHYADDLAALTTHLDLKNAVHVGFELIPPAEISEIIRAFPRLRMKNQFAETCRHLVAAKPETSYDNFLRDFGERFVPGYRVISTVDLLMNAPFAE